MHLVLLTLRKDARRLWPAVAVALALLALLARTDRWRADPMIGATEGWLNLLLPMAWACLIALAVLEEPLTGDRHFWLTRPHRWPALLAAKVLFAVLFVHLPAMLADAYILASRGFSPIGYLPQLAEKQLFLAAAITLPAMALASLVSSFTHFMLLLFAVAAAALFVGGGFRSMPFWMRPPDHLRGDLTILVACIAAIAIVWLQYRRRKAIVSRVAAIAAALCTGTLFGYVPETFDYRLRAALHPAPALSLGIEQRPLEPPRFIGTLRRDTVAIPVALSGVPAGVLCRIGAASISLRTSDGQSYHNLPFPGPNQYDQVSLAGRIYRFPYDSDDGSLWLTLDFPRSVYERLMNQHARVAGQMVVTFYRKGETTWMPLNRPVFASGVGLCSAAIREDQWTAGRVIVLCESPRDLPQTTRVTLSIPQIGREWHQQLRDYGNPSTGPHWAWLSPLDRANTFFNISDPRTRLYQYYVEVPLEHVDQAKIGITPEILNGYSIVNFDFPDVPLSSYHAEPRTYR